MWLFGKESLKVSHHPNKFVDNEQCGSGDIIALFCHVILQDYVIKVSCNFM